MKTAVIALTKNGADLALKLGHKLESDIYIKEEFIGTDRYKNGGTDEKSMNYGLFSVEKDFTSFVGKLFFRYDAFVFIMACGIAVRAIAPFIRDKKTDPAVVVVDEKGNFAISLLSGHIGGANKLAKAVSELTGAVPVITTATDVNDTVAFDVFAAENNCVIENTDLLKRVSSQLVNGGKVALYSEYGLRGNLPGNIIPYESEAASQCTHIAALTNRTDIFPGENQVLLIRPKNLVLGFGCKKGVPMAAISAAVTDFLKKNGKSPLSLKCIATIDLKEDEKGLQEYCNEEKLPMVIVPRDKIRECEGDFSSSEFVRGITGVPGVAEPCAVIESNNGRLICKKTVYPGITLALAEEKKVFNI